MTTPPEHAQLLAAGYTATPHPVQAGRIDYERGAVWLVYFAGPGKWRARVDSDRELWQTPTPHPTAAAALADVRARITTAANDLLDLAASATLERLP